MEIKMSNSPHSNYKLLLPYVLPYVAYVAIANLFGSLDAGINYALRIVVVSGILFWGWRRYVPFRRPGNTLYSMGVGIILGLAGTIFWVMLLSPFVTPGKMASDKVSFFMRLLASTLLVPVFEELLMRVYVFRLAHQWYIERKTKKVNAYETVFYEKSLNDFEPGEWSFFAILFSSIIFALGHQLIEWPSAIVYGLLMALLWVLRKDVLSCIVAHATTNLTFGIYVYITGSWAYW
jgi:membrane protease YdiL (CAAX protease family)